MRGSSRQAARETDDNVLRGDLWAADFPMAAVDGLVVVVVVVVVDEGWMKREMIGRVQTDWCV